jgi:hypothetical protein
MDSIMASPTNSVLVIVEDASGCCASALSAVETDLPSARAGPMHPNPVVRPAVTIEIAAIIDTLSIINILELSGSPGLGGCGNVYRRQNAENVGLYHPGK